MRLYELAMPVLQLIVNTDISVMALFTAYINDYLGYEIFCGELPHDFFHTLQENIKDSQDLRDALKDSGILQQGVAVYIDKAFEDCHMLYHFMDGEDVILNDPILSSFLSNDDRHMLEDMFKRWDDGTICQENWEDAFTAMCTMRASK